MVTILTQTDIGIAVNEGNPLAVNSPPTSLVPGSASAYVTKSNPRLAT